MGELTPPLPDATQLALERTRLAFERTLLAWIRTPVGLITFGFSVYKFFQYQRQTGTELPHHLIGPRGFAILMIGAGLFTLLFAAVEYAANIRRLRKQYGDVPRSMAMWLAALIS